MSRPWFAAIESPEPVPGESPDGPGLFYKARVQDLSPATVDRLVDHFARLWEGSRREVIDELYGDHGCPILADDVGVGPTPGQARAALAARREGGDR